MTTKRKMPREAIWFGARVIFESVGPSNDRRDRLYEERIMLVRAITEQQARAKAERFSRASGVKYRNVRGKEISWHFKEVLDVACLSWEQVITDGSEVYYAVLDEKRFRHLRSAICP